jgi:hypothetical protein
MGRFPPPGFAEGLYSSLGDYDECLDITSPPNESNLLSSSIIKGQYCLSKMILPFPSEESYREGEPVEKPFESNISYKNDLNLYKFTSTKSLIEKLNQSNGSIYNFGLFIPSVCRAEEIENLLNISENKFFLAIEKSIFF